MIYAILILTLIWVMKPKQYYCPACDEQHDTLISMLTCGHNPIHPVGTALERGDLREYDPRTGEGDVIWTKEVR